jgi:hypothetical protein
MYQQQQFKVLTNNWRDPANFQPKRETYYTRADAEAALNKDRDQFLAYLDREINDASKSDDAVDHLLMVSNVSQWKLEERVTDYAFASEYMYSDVRAWEVLRVVSENCIEIRRMDTEHNCAHLKQVPGGFAGHVVGQRDQKVTYASNPDNEVIRIRRRKNSRDQWVHKGVRFSLQTEPYAFYDFNF